MSTDTKGGVTLHGAALVAALALLTAWLLLHAWLAFHTDSSEVVWARLYSLIGSIEAVAFAAAGALFGTTVQRQRVEDARQRAAEAQDREKKAEAAKAASDQLATNGRALAAAVKAMEGEPIGRSARSNTLTEASEGVRIEELVALTRELFPD